MLLRLLKAERIKLKRSFLWLAFLFIPVVPAFLGTMNYLANIDILKNQWYSLWTQHTLFSCYFFLPILLGVYCSYLIHEEENNHNWNKTLTMPQKRSLIFLSKLLTAGSMILFSELWTGILFVISGKVIGLTAPVPLEKIILWCSFGTLGGMVTASVQLMISLLLKSFALPIGISLVGGISGLLFLAKDLGHLWPYSLMAYGMNSNSPQELLQSGYLWFIFICFIYILLFTTVCNVIFAKRDF